MVEEERCVTCNAALTTPFCPACGERRASDRSFSLREFVADFFEAVLSFDGRAIRTFVMLLRKPGELTVEYVRGSRLPYLAPLQCFLLFNLVYFAWATFAHDHTFDTPLYVHTHFTGYARTASAAVHARLARTGQSSDDFARAFDAMSTTQSKSLVLAMVPIFTLFVWFFTLGRRRFAVQHLTFSLHTFAFIFCMIPIANYLIEYPLVWILTRMHVSGNGELGFDAEISLAMAAWIGAYIALSVRRAYVMGWFRSIVTAIGLVGGLVIAMQLYRALLFRVTLWSV
ncbi:MAG TPA: DUF3667 domain-containing protein [Gemmatimonadaceae bacterium]